MSSLEVIYLILSIVCLVIAFVLISAETAYINLPKLRVEHLIRTNVRHAKTVAEIKNDMEGLLSTTSLIAAIADTVVAALGTALFVFAFGEAVGNPVGILVIAFLMFIFARVVPKLIAAEHPERLALLYARPIKLVVKLLKYVVRLASWFPIKIAGLFGEPSLKSALISKEEIHSIISVGEKEGVVAEDAAKIMQKAVKFGERQVREVMTPRTELSWIEREAKLSDFFAKYAENQTLRYPVYEETHDNIIGYLSIRDVVLAQAQANLSPDYSLEQLYRPVYRVPGSKQIGELFTEMRTTGHQMAAVISEYGGTSGIINIERLAEEIVGELGEELAVAEAQFELIGECSYQIGGNMRIDDVKDELGLDIPPGEYQTMAGFALSLLGHLPAEGEQVVYTPQDDKQVNYNSITLLIKKVEENRIRRLLVSWELKEEAPSEEEA